MVLEGLLELTCQQDPAAWDAAVSAGAFATLADALHNHTDHLRVVKVAAVVLMRLTYQHVQHSQLALDAGCGDGLRVARRRLESMQASMQGGAEEQGKACSAQRRARSQHDGRNQRDVAERSRKYVVLSKCHTTVQPTLRSYAPL